MKSIICFEQRDLFIEAFNLLAKDAHPALEASTHNLTIEPLEEADLDAIIDILHSNGVHMFTIEDVETRFSDDCDTEPDQFRHDGEADADALASAGMGDDEAYGGGCERLGDEY